jgi:hypothetical protein
MKYLNVKFKAKTAYQSRSIYAPLCRSTSHSFSFLSWQACINGVHPMLSDLFTSPPLSITKVTISGNGY